MSLMDEPVKATPNPILHKILDDLAEGKDGAKERLYEYVIADTKRTGLVYSHWFFESLGIEQPESYRAAVDEYYKQKAIEYAEQKKAEEQKRKDKIKKLIKIGIIIILILSIVVGAIVYHNYAKKEAYNTGHNAGYSKGYNRGYDKGYDEGYDKYKEIKDEYNFYHKYAVITTNAGKKYHKYDCYHIKNRSFYIYNIDNAKAQGYTACLDCLIK